MDVLFKNLARRVQAPRIQCCVRDYASAKLLFGSLNSLAKSCAVNRQVVER